MSVKETAEALYESGCLRFGDFTIKSGAHSPYYIDLANLLTTPRNFKTITAAVTQKIKQIKKTAQVNKLATVELKGALILPTIASKVNLPCTIVRKGNKAYGVTGNIAGAQIQQDEYVLFFDDVISEGNSKLEAIKPLQQRGARIKHILVIIDRQQGGKETLKKLGIRLHSLATITELTESFERTAKITAQQRDIILDYVKKKQP